jgi:hypothetical protein
MDALNLILSSNFALKGESAAVYTAATFFGIGLTVANCPPIPPYEYLASDGSIDQCHRWCSKTTADEYMKLYPFDFNEFLIRTWLEHYFKYVLMIKSVAGEEDLLEKQEKMDWCFCMIC